jgi:hypothetical protein
MGNTFSEVGQIAFRQEVNEILAILGGINSEQNFFIIRLEPDGDYVDLYYGPSSVNVDLYHSSVLYDANYIYVGMKNSANKA